MSEPEDPEDRRTEGVRIIGAQEAAEAAARPDVVRRRSRREKRYGDRPDNPAPASDLPKITISTTETEGAADPGRFGAVPLVRPGEEQDVPGPAWADEPEPAYGDPHSGFGHARIVGDEELGAPEAFEEQTAAAPTQPATPEDDLRQPVEWETGGFEDSGSGSTSWTSAPEQAPAWSDTFDDADATRQWSAEELSEELAASNYGSQAGDHEPFPDEESSAHGGLGLDEQVSAGEQLSAGGDPSVGDDDSFVLPHWTEPPTGQVPKVVIGDDAPDPDSLATYGNQPRWRDEGEREVVSDFDDLIDEGPRLGALGVDDDVDDDFFSGAESEDLYDDDFEELGYDEFDEVDDEAHAPARRRPPGRRGGRQRREVPEEPTRTRGDRDLVSAVAVGIGLVAVGLLCFAGGAIPTTILATIVVTFAAWEYFSAVRTAGYNPATLLGMVSVIGVMVASYTSGLAAYPVVIGLSVLTGLLWYLWVAPGGGAVQNLGLTLLGVMWVGVLGSFSTLFLGLGRAVEAADPSVTSNLGIGVLIAAVVATVSHDVGAYFVGRFVGRTPLSAASPNKTQEGLAGGVLTSLVVTVLVVGVVGIAPIGDNLSQTFVFALLCALAAPLGDLAESFVKRDLDIKDMGSVLPGHGGVLDRFDGLLFVLPVAYFVSVLFGVWSGTGS